MHCRPASTGADSTRGTGELVRVSVIGAGAVGAWAARHLGDIDEVDKVAVRDVDRTVAAGVAKAVGPKVAVEPIDATLRADVAVVATPGAEQAHWTQRCLDDGVAVVSATDGLLAIERVLNLDAHARKRDVPVVVGVGFSPGFSCLLARHGASWFDEVDEIHVARSGTGGPACARQHHAALAGSAVEWRDGRWVRRRAGTGRELAWFPEPIGGRDCYRAEVGEPILLKLAFPDLVRASARIAANRRDRLTSRLPMLRPPHPDGGPGGVRVELRGRREWVTGEPRAGCSGPSGHRGGRGVCARRLGSGPR